MKILTPILFGMTLATGTAMAQEATGARAEFEATTGPVTVVSVQPPLPHAAEYQATVAEFDGNGDGVLVRSEVPIQHALASEFHLVDTDRNGRVTRAELTNWK